MENWGKILHSSCEVHAVIDSSIHPKIYFDQCNVRAAVTCIALGASVVFLFARVWRQWSLGAIWHIKNCFNYLKIFATVALAGCFDRQVDHCVNKYRTKGQYFRMLTYKAIQLRFQVLKLHFERHNSHDNGILQSLWTHDRTFQWCFFIWFNACLCSRLKIKCFQHSARAIDKFLAGEHAFLGLEMRCNLYSLPSFPLMFCN